MFDKLIVKAAKHLDEMKIPYMIMGGQAVLKYGEPRLTKDIDITLGIGIEKFSLIQELIKDTKLKSLVRSPKKFVKQFYVMPAIDPKSQIRIDFIFSDSMFERNAMKRSGFVRILNKKIRFASAEDVIIQKIIAGRPRDLEDVSTILLKQSKLNIRYIRKWLSEFEINLDISLLKIFNHLLKECRIK
ncbi:MAG: nucleotidyltransferase [Bacteroidota bacterium]|nr:nucleotidyltransferase [Bacteroidota bacterium]